MVRYGRNVTYVRPPGSGGGAAEYRIYNLNTRSNTVSGSSWNLGPGVAAEDFNTGLSLPTLIYVPNINRYWFCVAVNGQTNMVWHEIDPTTTPWSITIKTDFTGNVPIPPMAPYSGTYTEPGSKHMYIPSMNAIIYFYRGGTTAPGCNMYVYKF
jgi:hypothetical protein